MTTPNLRLVKPRSDVPPTDVIEALQEERELLWDIKAICDTMSRAMQDPEHSGWPADVPCYPNLLRMASEGLDDMTARLEVLQERLKAQGESPA